MKYSVNEILNNNNLIFDLKYDTSYKKVFLNNNNSKYLALIINKIFNHINYNNSILLNTEIPNTYNKSSYSDLILKINNYEYIIEMNKYYSKILFYKNNHYLLKEHSRRNNKKNKYGINNYTILVNFDNYDILNKNKLLYESNILYKKYNIQLYNNIKILHINLDYLKKKYYNEEELNELEKLLIIFIEQRKDKILNVTNNKYVKELIDFMDTLKMEQEYIATYNKEEFEEALKEEFITKQKKFNKKQEIFNTRQEIFNTRQEKFNIRQQKFNKRQEKFNIEQKKFIKEKEDFARELKILGIPLEKIKRITNMSIKDITML